MTTENDAAWDSLTYEEKNRLLYERQKHMRGDKSGAAR